jgi:site-specific recombinase XerD
MTDTLETLVRVYVRERRNAGDYAPSTATNVRCDLLAFAGHINLPPAKLTGTIVEAWMGATPGARSTKRRRFSYVKLFCQWLVRRGYLKSDPTLGLRPPRAPKPIPRGVAPADIGRLILSVPDPRARFVVVWMAQLGLRCVELTRLELGDVNFEDRIVAINGKGNWPRLMPITDEAWHALTGLLLERGTAPGPLLRMTANHLSRLVSRWMGAAGVHGTAHALRHSMATHLLRLQGADIKDVQAALGHQSLTSTAVYLPFTDVERLRQVMAGRWYGPRVA